MSDYRTGSHVVCEIKYHLVWTTKYRYKVLKGDIALRMRALLQQGCEARNIKIIKGSISKEHVHMLVSCPSTLSPSRIVQYLKGRSSHLIQDEFPELKKRYWGQHIWSRGYFCATIGNVDEETIKQYIENQDKEYDNEDFKIVK